MTENSFLLLIFLAHNFIWKDMKRSENDGTKVRLTGPSIES